MKRSVFLINTMLFAMILLLAACSKEKSDSRPVINIIEPQALSVHSVTDTLHIVARVVHEKPIAEISIMIRNDANDVVTVPRYLFPGTKDYALDVDYPVNAAGLLSGSYRLTVGASDGALNAKEYQPIYLEGVEREFQQAIALCRPSLLKTYVYAINEDFDAQSIKTLNFGFIRAEVSSHQRKLKVLGPQPSALYAYDLDELIEDEWLAASPPFPVFNDLHTDGQITYVASGNGDIKGVNQYGQVQFVTPLSDTVPQLLHAHENLVLSFSKTRTGPGRYIMQHYEGTGSLKAFSRINFDIVSMFSADDESCALFTMDGSSCAIYIYKVEGNYLDESVDLPDGELRDVVRVGANDYLIAHSDGIFKYTLGTPSAVLWGVADDVRHMAYDDIRSLVFCSTLYDIRVYRADNAGLVKQITLLFPIYDIMIQYNK